MTYISKAQKAAIKDAKSVQYWVEHFLKAYERSAACKDPDCPDCRMLDDSSAITASLRMYAFLAKRREPGLGAKHASLFKL